MRFHPTPIVGVTLVELDLHSDERGSFARSYCRKDFAAAGIEMDIAQANISRNRAALTLRGLHYQQAPNEECKLVRCSRGRIFDVAVDLRANSPTYLDWYGIELDSARPHALSIGPGLAHGFLTLEPDCEVDYLMSTEYVPQAAAGVRWNDPALGIEWPAVPAVISDRDRDYPLLNPVP